MTEQGEAVRHGVAIMDKTGIECVCGWSRTFSSGGWMAFNDHIATPLPAVKDWPDCCTHDNPHHGPVPVGGVHWSDGTDLPVAPALDVGRLRAIIVDEIQREAQDALDAGIRALREPELGAWNYVARHFEQLAPYAADRILARLTDQQEDDR